MGYAMKMETPHEVLSRMVANDGSTFDELSAAAPVLMVFLRHLGCSFCRQTLADLRDARPDLESSGMSLALVHMADEVRAARLFRRYRLDDVPRFSDPDKRLYGAFGLGQGTLRQLIGRRNWIRAFEAAVVRRHGAGWPVGDFRQMPGVFLMDQGAIVAGHVHVDAGERPDYRRLVAEARLA